MSAILETQLVDISRRFEATEDLSAIERLSSPTPAQPASAHSRTSSTGDSAFYEYDASDYNEEHYKQHQLCHQRTLTPMDSVTASNNAMLDKIIQMDERMRNMEARLKQETQERSKLATKVAKLEEENETLKSNRMQAVSQIQTFSEKFFAMKEPLAPKFDPSSPVFCSPLNSPRGSNLELRRIGSTSSMASRASSRHSSMKSRPTSGISL